MAICQNVNAMFIKSISRPVPFKTLMRRVLCVGLLMGCTAGGVMAQTQPTPMTKLRIIGGLADLNQFTRNEEPFWTRELSRLTGGKYSADIVPFDRAGVSGGDMLRMIQLSVVPFGTVLLSLQSAKNPEFSAPDLAGLNPDMASLKKNLAAFRPYLEKTLRDRHGIETLAIYVYPAQVVFCKKPLTALADLSGRRVRVSSATQSDFLGALNAVPVLTGFAELMGSLSTGNTECAITGSMSGNTLGLHEVTTHVYALPVTWGMAIFGANVGVWTDLPPDLRALLSRELPKLEAAIWAESERETRDGLACNTGAATCSKGRKGRMVEVAASAQEERRLDELFKSTVLVKWLQRCGARCHEVWNQTIGPVRGVLVPPPP